MNSTASNRPTIQPSNSPTPPVSPRERRIIMAVDRLVLFIAKHWLALVIVGLVVFAGLPFLAPVLMHYGYVDAAEVIYKVYSLTCHQMAYRSFFLFGAQPAYSLDELQARVPGTHAEGAASFFWRDFLGDASVGYKMAWCERDTAIYVSMLCAALLFGLVRTRVQPLDGRVFLLLLVPLAIDGAWQLVTSPLHLLPFLPPHESTAESRTLTGALFGIGAVWMIFPRVDVAMRETYAQAAQQFARARAREAKARFTVQASRNP